MPRVFSQGADRVIATRSAQVETLVTLPRTDRRPMSLYGSGFAYKPHNKHGRNFRPWTTTFPTAVFNRWEIVRTLDFDRQTLDTED